MSLLVNYIAKTWVDVFLKRRDAVMAHLFSDLSSEDKLRFFSCVVLKTINLLPFD